MKTARTMVMAGCLGFLLVASAAATLAIVLGSTASPRRAGDVSIDRSTSTVTAPDPSAAVQVEEWEVEWETFFDDFEDGVFPDGRYVADCGSVTESGGKLILQGTGTDCQVERGGGIVAGIATVVVFSGATVSSTFSFDLPDPEDIYGHHLVHVGEDGKIDDGVSLMLIRAPALGVGPDVLSVTLYSTNAQGVSPIAGKVLCTTATSCPSENDPSNFGAIELELELTADPSGMLLIPSARFRKCAGSVCADEGFEALDPVQPQPEDRALSASLWHTAALFGRSFGDPADSFSYSVEEWALTLEPAMDDFEDGVFGATAAYFDVPEICKVSDEDEVDGKLTLRDPPNTCGFESLLFGEITASATYDFQVPAFCGIVYGMVIASPGGTDFAVLSLGRGPVSPTDSSNGDALTLMVVSEPATAGGPAPFVKRAVLSTDPASDPDLTDLTAIKLELTLRLDDSETSLLPAGSYQLCTGPRESLDCADPIVLADFDPTGLDPDIRTCDGTRLEEHFPPGDGGALSSGDLHGVNLFLGVVPEPATILLQLAAIGSLAVLTARRGKT